MCAQLNALNADKNSLHFARSTSCSFLFFRFFFPSRNGVLSHFPRHCREMAIDKRSVGGKGTSRCVGIGAAAERERRVPAARSEGGAKAKRAAAEWRWQKEGKS